MNKIVICVGALWVVTLNCWAGKPVTVDGFAASGKEWADKVKQDLDDLRKLTNDKIQPDIETLRKYVDGDHKIASLMAKQISLEKYGQLLKKAPNGRTQSESATDLSYNGQNLQGANYGYIDNLIGSSGTPIAMDRALPYQLVPLSQSTGNLLTSFAQQMGSQLLQGAAQTFLGGASTNSSVLSAVKALAGTLGQMTAGDGVFVRAYQGGADDAYAWVQGQTNPATLVSFLASTSSSYNPVLGSGNYTIPLSGIANLNDVLSSGAYNAVSNYQSSSGSSGSNAYSTFATSMLPYAVSALSQTIPGSALVITQTMVDAQAQGIAPDSNQPTIQSGSIPVSGRVY